MTEEEVLDSTPNMQMTITSTEPETHHDAGMHADNTYKEVAIDKTCPEKGKHEMPRTTAHDILNTKSNTIYNEEFATLTSYNKEFAAAATIATYDKESAK